MPSLSEYIDELTRLGWRGLVLYVGGLTGLEKLMDRRVELCIGAEAGFCDKTVSVAEAHRLIGSEYSSVALLLENRRGWPGNLLAQTTEYVAMHGYYLLQAPLSLAGTGFGRYLYRVALGGRNTVVAVGDRVVYVNVYREEPRRPPRPVPRSSDRFVRKLESMAATEDQARALRLYPSFLYGRERLFLVYGDRGRGKSAVLGMAAAYTMRKRRGSYYVVSRSPYSVQSFYRHLVEALRVLGARPRVEERNGLVVAVYAEGSGIRYVEPWRLDAGRVAYKPLFVDEAAAVGVARLRRWYRDVGKVAASTTIHGYEGSGRVLLKMLREELRSTVPVKARTPIRYYPGDPLEVFMYRLFHLDAEPPEEMRRPDRIVYEEVSPESLATDYALLRKIYGLLVSAHYRNEPDDLVMLLDTNLFEIRVLRGDGEIVAVAQLREEDSREPRGAVELLDRYGLLGEAGDTRMWRIVRIAVAPPLQRMGYGSRLLRMIEEEAAGRGMDAVTAVFSGFDTLWFWLRNNYTPYYISPRYNRVTGEKNVAVMKPLSSRGRVIRRLAASILYTRLQYSSHVSFRDLAAEKIAGIMEAAATVMAEYTRRLDCMRLRRFLRGGLFSDIVSDILIRYLDASILGDLDDAGRIIVVARLLQGKSLPEIASILGAPLSRASDMVEKVLGRIARMVYERVCLDVE